MITGDQIKYLQHKEIDKAKWDACISNASNGLIYACSFYLDSMVKYWDALIMNDYEVVMPLPHRKKLSIHYLYQPFLTPVLGVFGKNISEQLVCNFLEAIPEFFKLWDISLNQSNLIPKKFQLQFKRSNYLLSFAGQSYESLQNSYSDNIRRNIAKAVKSGCIAKKNISVTQIISICKREWPKFTTPEKNSFDLILSNFKKFSPFATSYGVYHPSGKLLSSCVFLIFQKRAYYWLVGNEPEAKEFGASPMLLDQFIKDHAGKDLTLDFEGSDAASVAEFYRRLGATLETYTTIYNNKLPFPLSLLKRMPSSYVKLIS
jgi:hypothetical protein